VDPSRVFAIVVALLVISCPCALGLATPVALALARAHAARRGILLASAGALEALAKVETVVVDKTGTLTLGELDVMSVLAARGAIPHDTSLGLFDEGFVAETCSTPGTAAFRLRALAENPGARSRDGLRHELPGIDEAELAALVRAVERDSGHPVGQALRR